MISREWKRLMKEHEDFKEKVLSEHSRVEPQLPRYQDIVKEPEHYARWKIEPITYIMMNGFEFWRGNIIKYTSRAGFKLYSGKTKDASEILDLKKVIRYAEMRINQLEGKEKL